MYHPLEANAHFGALSHSGVKDFLLDGRQMGLLLTADDFGVGFADIVLAFPG
jgi:hypothetical protein